MPAPAHPLITGLSLLCGAVGFLPELQPQSESVFSTHSLKINMGLHFSFHLFIVVLSTVGWKQIVRETLIHFSAGK